MGSLVVRNLVVPKCAQRVNGIVGMRAAVIPSNSNSVEFLVQPTDTNAEDEASAGEHVERCAFLRKHDGITQRQDHDASCQLQSRRMCTNPGEPHKWIGYGRGFVARHLAVT